MAEDLSESLIEALTSRDATNALAIAADIALNQAIESVGGAFPGVANILALGQGIREVRNGRLRKKNGRFAAEMDSVSDDDRYKFQVQLETDAEFRETVGENLLLLLDQLDDMRKPRLAGKAFAAFLSRQIDRGSLDLILRAISRVSYVDLISLAQKQGQVVWFRNDDEAPRLHSAGLLDIQVDDRYVSGPSVQYRMSELGRQLLDVCFPHFELAQS